MASCVKMLTLHESEGAFSTSSCKSAKSSALHMTAFQRLYLGLLLPVLIHTKLIGRVYTKEVGKAYLVEGEKENFCHGLCSSLKAF